MNYGTSTAGSISWICLRLCVFTPETQHFQRRGNNGPYVRPRRLRVAALHGGAHGSDEGAVHHRRGLRTGGLAPRGAHAGKDHPRHAGGM